MKIMNISTINNLISLFKYFNERNKSQVFGCSIIINKHLIKLSSIIPNNFINTIPTKFVDNIKEAEYFLNNMEQKYNKRNLIKKNLIKKNLI